MLIKHPLAPINLLLTSILGTLIIDSDFGYSIDSKDSMSRPYNPYNILCFLINGWFSCRVCTYYKFQTRFWNTFSYFYLGSLCLTYYFSLLVSSKINIPSLMTVMYIPIIQKIAYYFSIWQDSTYTNLIKDIFEENNNMTLNRLDRIIRLQIFKDLQTQKVIDNQKIGIYSLIIKKKQQFN
ncbi:hypothetical protein ABPG72_015171 [Tetrahymena utriculariae]